MNRHRLESSFLQIAVVDLDPDYLALKISASNGRFSGATFVYGRLDTLVNLAETIAGFPSDRMDQRKYTFGTQDKNVAGGYCSLKFYCTDSSGHAAVDVEIEDDDTLRPAAVARFAFQIVAADIDRFVSELKSLHKSRSGKAMIESRG